MRSCLFICVPNTAMRNPEIDRLVTLVHLLHIAWALVTHSMQMCTHRVTKSTPLLELCCGLLHREAWESRGVCSERAESATCHMASCHWVDLALDEKSLKNTSCFHFPVGWFLRVLTLGSMPSGEGTVLCALPLLCP